MTIDIYIAGLQMVTGLRLPASDERALCDWLTTWGQPRFAAFTIVGQDRVTTKTVWFGSDPYTATRWGAITLHWIEYEPKQYNDIRGGHRISMRNASNKMGVVKSNMRD